MSTAQLSGSPKTILIQKPGGPKEKLEYAPLNYMSRGKLELIYAPIAKSPSDSFEESLATADDTMIEARGGQEWVESMRKQLRAASVGWQPSPEEPMAEALFLENVGRPEHDTRDYRAAMLAVVLGARNPALDDEEKCAEYLGYLTKGQLRDIFQYALEVGPYVPK